MPVSAGRWAAAAAGACGLVWAAGCGQVREVAATDLTQVAVVGRDAEGTVIYYSPDLCLEVGRLVCGFERHHAHTLATSGKMPRGASPAVPSGNTWATPQDILETDCRATSSLGSGYEAIARAAADFYRRQGERRLAPNYPTGEQRAQQILDCLGR
jgi:hypothetical protein